MFIKKGDKLKCHTTDRIENTNEIFCIENKKYNIICFHYIGVDEVFAVVYDERGEEHLFNVYELVKGESPWFTIRGVLIEKYIDIDFIDKIKSDYHVDSYYHT